MITTSDRLRLHPVGVTLADHKPITHGCVASLLRYRDLAAVLYTLERRFTRFGTVARTIQARRVISKRIIDDASEERTSKGNAPIHPANCDTLEAGWTPYFAKIA